jgi:hypothetical protein
LTLFTAEALIEAGAHEREDIPGGRPQLVRQTYERWLRTQSEPGPAPAGGPVDGGLVTEDRLHARRAPGNACLSGVAPGAGPARRPARRPRPATRVAAAGEGRARITALADDLGALRVRGAVLGNPH